MTWLTCLLVAGNVISAHAAAAEIAEIVSTASRSERPLSDEAGNIALIGRQELDLVKSTHFSELAVRIPGVNFSRNNGQEMLASIRSPIFTGAGACGAFLMAEDGIPLRAAGFCNVNELFEAFTEQAARIEITKGPGSALYGSNALHGMINIITPAANRDGGSLSMEGGAWDFIRFNISEGVTTEKGGLLGLATVSHDGGWRDQSGYDQQKITLRHDYNGDVWTISSSLNLTNLDQETAGFIVGRDAYKNRALARQNPNPEAFRKARSLRYWSRFSRETGDGVRWQVTPYFRTMNMTFLMHFLPGQPLEENSQTSVGLQNGLYINEGSRLEIITGIDGEYTRGSLQQTQAHPTTGSAFLRATIPSGKQYDYDVNSLQTAAFLQADWAINQRLHLVAGGRLEYMRYDYTNNMISGRTDENGNACGFGGCRYSRPASRRDSFTSFSPKISLRYSYHSTDTLYLTLSQGFRAPQTSELYRLQRRQKTADLNNVSLKNIEVGARGSRGRWRYNISLYAMKKTGYIFRDAAFFNVDNGKSDHIGADIMVRFSLNDRLGIRGNLSLARHRYAFDYISNGINLNGRDIDTAPRNFGSMQINWRPLDRLTTELEWVHMGAYYTDPENLHKYPGHDYVNLRMTVKITDSYGFFLRLMNVTDTKYAERADYTSFTGDRYLPGKPRALYIGLKTGF